MIRAFVFDLDGTLVKTERLKALSYARATKELCPHTINEKQVLDAFKEVVGLSRREVALELMKRFDLEEKASKRMAEFGVSTPWQAFVQIRLNYYNAMIADPQVLRENQWAHNIDLLYVARQRNCATALATMSHCDQVNHILTILNLKDQFDFVATRDDVRNGKPDPEIYQLVAAEIRMRPEECLVIEDSPAGVKAALAAGMHVIAVSTPFTMEPLHRSGLLEDELIVDDPTKLVEVVHRFTTVI